MPTPDQARLAKDRAQPQLMQLWWALRPLASVTRFMQTGAHPDDEISGMLAALAYRDGLTISYACATRGEGGQNDIGTETGADLGALRTAEMEAACDVLGLRLYWLCTHPEDTITDFGFSKSGEETLARWGKDRTLQRFVEIVRTERPDILCPTFLDVPGQHGHHRAMTQAAHEVMATAADPAYDCALPPWQVKKLYLPAWSGAGQAYDDDLPPPDATLTVPGRDPEPASGWPWTRIGQQSRAFHRSQGMGRWIASGDGQDWPLHLVQSHVSGPDQHLWSGLPHRVQDLGTLPGAAPIADALIAAGDAIETCIAAFPDQNAVAHSAALALSQIRAAQETCPAPLRLELEHRLADKAIELGHVLRIVLAVQAHASVAQRFVTAGDSVEVALELHRGAAKTAKVVLDLPKGWSHSKDTLRIASDAAPHDAYRTVYDPRDVPQPRLCVQFQAHGVPVQTYLPFEQTPVVLPAKRADVIPQAAVINHAAGQTEVGARFDRVAPESAQATLSLPEGWHSVPEAGSLRITPPQTGAFLLPVQVDGHPAMTARQIAHPHIAATALARPAVLRLSVMETALPNSRVGYIGGGNDRVGHWLQAIGLDVTDLSDADLSQSTALDGIDSLVIGIFAMRFRPGLAEAMPAIHRWTEAGGTLVTLYHRPWDNWDPDTTPPRRLEIGQPSLRWRVTDQAAAVTHLVAHPLLSTPNKIGPEDWDGWAKERGLYFAKSWDPAYIALLQMADPGEEPHTGALLVADVGAGRHVHTSLILHHQMENLVPGAFRLMANLVSPRGA